MQLFEIRKKIDEIDEKLIPLIEQRVKLVTKVAFFKKKENYPVLDSNREQEVLAKISAKLSEQEFKDVVLASFQALMDVSKEYQRQRLTD